MHMMPKVLSNSIYMQSYTIYIIQAVYTPIETDQLVKEIDILLSIIKATSPISRISCPWKWCSGLFYSTRFLNYEVEMCELNTFLKVLTS